MGEVCALLSPSSVGSFIAAVDNMLAIRQPVTEHGIQRLRRIAMFNLDLPLTWNIVKREV